MIYDKIKNLKEYASYLPALGTIADYLEKTDLKSLPIGSVQLDGGITLNISEYDPYPAADKWEAHIKYTDLQIVVDGCERMDSAPIENAEGGCGYNDADDYEIFDTCGETYATIYGDEEVFALFEPKDAHRPGIRTTCDHVKKAVFKIPV